MFFFFNFMFLLNKYYIFKIFFKKKIYFFFDLLVCKIKNVFFYSKKIKNIFIILSNIFIKITKFYFYIFMLMSLLIYILYYNDIIYLDSPTYDVVVKIKFKGITYNVSGLVLNEMFFDKGGYFCFILVCHIVYSIALNEQLWNTAFKSDFVICRPLPYASTFNGSITTSVVNEETVNVLIENFSIKYEPAITPGNGARRRFLRTLKQLVGNPNLQEFYYSGSGSEPGSVVIEGILSKNNYNIK